MTTGEVVRPDDAVRSQPNVYLGPDQFTLPKPIPYTTLAAGFVACGIAVFVVLVGYRAGVYGVSGGVTVGFSAVCAAVVVTYGLATVTGSDVPVRSIPAFTAAELRGWSRRPGPERTYQRAAKHVRGINPGRDAMALRRQGIRYVTAGAVLLVAGIVVVVL